MIPIIDRYANIWKKHRFKILVATSVVCILVLSICNKGQGTWSLEYHNLPGARRTIVRDSKGEQECRRVLEKLFQRPFTKERPSFLTNQVTGKPLEIDCCNYDLQLGVEYNGKQHYTFVKGMQKNYESFQLQQYRDEMKKKLCDENDFQLIIVPYTIPVSSIENYLVEKLRELGYL